MISLHFSCSRGYGKSESLIEILGYFEVSHDILDW